MSKNSIKNIKPLGFPWATQDPFIFCAYHNDAYPGKDANNGPNVSLEGRNIGSDFSGRDGWSMYHGRKVPGFPYHPHKGFETVSIVKQGTIDHSDSIGGSGRFKKGDVQWLTSGKGVQHAEMFPLLEEGSNPLEMFQLWLNLPKRSKMVEPHYKMLWNEDIPKVNLIDENGLKTTIDVIAGNFQDSEALKPTPDSWAADPRNEVQIWTIEMEAGAKFEIEGGAQGLNRALYYYEGSSLKIDGDETNGKHILELHSDEKSIIQNGPTKGCLLFLQGRPINEPIAQHGPFVMNTQEEIQQAFQEYRQTQFGGWPFENSEPVHSGAKDRFAVYPDGSREEK